ILLLSTYPFALFYSVVYTESLFLFLTVGAFYAMRRRYLLLAALAGFAAGLTRPNGFWLAVPLLWLATTGAEGRGGRGGRGGRDVPAIRAALAPLAGVAMFSEYLSLRLGDAQAGMPGH